MLKQTFDYTDFNGHPRTAEMHFNLTDVEVLDFSGRKPANLTEDLDVLVKTENIRGILTFLRELIEWSYGIKSEDGIRFEKSPEITRAFVQSAYYSDWLFSLFENDAAKGILFIQAVLPPSLIKQAQDRMGFDEAVAEPAAQTAAQTVPPVSEQGFMSRTEARQQAGYTRPV